MQQTSQRGQAVEGPVPIDQCNGNDTAEFTRIELAQTLGELVKLGFLRAVQSPEDGKTVTLYQLTEKRP